MKRNCYCIATRTYEKFKGIRLIDIPAWLIRRLHEGQKKKVVIKILDR